MKELQTAKRLGHETDLKWLTLEDGKIINAIKHDGKEIKINEIGELIHSYDPIAPVSMFKMYFTQKQLKQEREDKKVMKESTSKKEQPKSKPVEKRPNKPKPQKTEELEAAVETEQYTGNFLQETFSDTVETTWVLEIYKLDGELFYSIEFEDEEDFSYHLRKKKEKFPNYKFVRKTVRSMVSYAEL